MLDVEREGGFTLIEVIVVAGIIAVLAGILVPLIFKEIDESKIARAQADIRSISSAMIVFKKDTGNWPAKDGTCTESVTIIVGDGATPTFPAGYDRSNQFTYNDYLPSDVSGCYPNWKGPYMARVNADPWGRHYSTNVKDLYNNSGNPVWIISAGPNGVVDTDIAPGQQSPAGDDIGIRLQ